MPPWSRASLKARLRGVLGASGEEPAEDQQAHESERSAPQLSVVMPIHNVEDYLDACIASVLEQSFTSLELILVEDGSTDGSAAIAEKWAQQDDRVVLHRQANAGLGAARNAGTALATGEFLAFADSDDLLLPNAYALMVKTLRRTGSELVIGSFVRGDERQTYVPDWVARVHARGLTGITVEEHPEVVRDITAWNKVFRRSFWDQHELSFPEGVRYEDQVIITRALLLSTSFDVLDKAVYLWRTRSDGKSITQQKGSIDDLQDRLRSLSDSWDLVSSMASEAVQDAWFAKWLGFDFLGYFELALEASGPYWESLQSALAKIHTDIRPSVLDDVPLYPRLMSWLLIKDERAAAEEILVFNERHHHSAGWPTGRDDGELHARVPLGDVRVPAEITRVTNADRQPRCRLQAARWEGHTLVLLGSAFLTYVDGAAGARELEVCLRDDDDGSVVRATVTPLSGDEYDVGSQRRFEDHSDSGFEARVDARELIGDDDEPTRRWRVELTQRFAGVTHSTGFERVNHLGISAARSTLLLEDRSVRLEGGTSDTVVVQVARHWSMVTGAEPAAGGGSRLTVRGPSGDSLRRLFHLADGNRVVVRPTEVVGDELTVELEPSSSGVRLFGRHESGARSTTVLAEGLDVVTDDTGAAFLHAGSARAAQLGPVATMVLVDAVEGSADALVVSGVCTAAPGTKVRLRLVGDRAMSERSTGLTPGRFEVRVPVFADPWGLGRAPVPADDYVLAVADDPAADVLLASALRSVPPPPVDAGGYAWSCGGGESRLFLLATAQARADRGVHRQQLLRDRYAEQRSADRLPAVLFECFYGRTVGDSPLAVLRELVDRGSDLDLVWGVRDWSLPTPEGARAVLHSSAEWFELLARARYVVASNNFPFFFEKAPGQVLLQTWHGTPLKKIGHDIVSDSLMTRSYMRMMDASAAEWDYLVSPSPFCSGIFPGAFRYPGPLLETGYPRNDVLVAPDRDVRRASVRAGLGIADEQRVVLYAPTWRDTIKVGNRPAKQLYLDPAELVRRAPDVTVLVRGHANTADSPSVNNEGHGPVLDVTLHPDIADLYLAADILVTDYSSVMFDFALLDRPIHLLTPDLESYRDESRGFYVDLEEVAPGPLHRSQETLIDAIAARAEDTYGDARARFRETFCPLDDGAAAARVVDAVWGANAPRS